MNKNVYIIQLYFITKKPNFAHKISYVHDCYRFSNVWGTI